MLTNSESKPMTIDEFREELNDIESNLLNQFAISNNTVKVGDLIRDHMGSGIVKRISVVRRHSGGAPSECLYTVDCLTKSGNPAKREPVRRVYQSNLRGWND